MIPETTLPAHAVASDPREVATVNTTRCFSKTSWSPKSKQRDHQPFQKKKKKKLNKKKRKEKVGPLWRGKCRRRRRKSRGSSSSSWGRRWSGEGRLRSGGAPSSDGEGQAVAVAAIDEALGYCRPSETCVRDKPPLRRIPNNRQVASANPTILSATVHTDLVRLLIRNLDISYRVIELYERNTLRIIPFI